MKNYTNYCRVLILMTLFSCAVAPLKAQTDGAAILQNGSQNNFANDFLPNDNLSFRVFSRKVANPQSVFISPAKNVDLQNLPVQISWKYVRPEAKARLKKYLNRSFGVLALIGAGAGATISQITDSPEEWENNAKGFARRFASGYAENAIQESTIYGLDETFRVDSQFYKKGKSERFKTRLANALLSGVTARSASGKRVPGFSRFVGTYASSIIAAEVWYPKRYNYQDGLREGTYSLGFNIGLNLLREFILPSK